MAWTASQRQWRIKLLWKRDGPRCWLCGGLFSKSRPVTIDHAIPKAMGGTNELHNLRLAHLDCNRQRGCIERTKPKAALVRALNTRLTISA